ncbi:TMEM43 family protein [Reyranella sp. MMS21-HV4-11]|uniref:TMEM43 family protein n=1 Tax=Reyranella humidisoli TaxID=2849149 RepID=A0ABS6IRH7_9HYPH|nr:TMEM43 family protein [Reyranella sp. MMS21-HV4-11]MBU8877197.1 TMEM43 family protein [Reyranella sp. MMS21-HV4-11]
MENPGTDQFTEVTNTSWFARLGQAIVGVLIGFVLIAVSIGVLFWNEGRAIRTAQGLSEGAGIVRSVAADRVDPSNNGRLIHVSGMLSTAGPVADPDFALRVRGVRISFSEVPLQTASVVAAQSGDGFAPFATRTGTTVELISAGTVPPAVMFQHAEEENVTMTWVLRLIGAILMLVGFSFVLRPLAVVGSVIPLLGDVIGAGTLLVAMVCTAASAPVVIALAWLWYRPLVGIGVLAVGAAATWGLMKLLRARAAARKAALPAA